jgi:hypothetical protein
MLSHLEEILGYSEEPHEIDFQKPIKKQITLKELIRLCWDEIMKQSHLPRQRVRNA